MVCLMLVSVATCASLFFFNDPSTTEISTFSLHDALPISFCAPCPPPPARGPPPPPPSPRLPRRTTDRKSTRLNSSHTVISYAVFCLKKKKKQFMTLTKKHSPKNSPKPTAQISAWLLRRKS